MSQTSILNKTVRLLKRGVLFEVKRLRREVDELRNIVSDLQHKQRIFVEYVEDICRVSNNLNDRLGKIKRKVVRTISDEELSNRIKQGINNSNIKNGRPFIEHNKEEIIKIRQKGLSLKEIALRLGCSHSTVKRRLRNIKEKKNGEENQAE